MSLQAMSAWLSVPCAVMPPSTSHSLGAPSDTVGSHLCNSQGSAHLKNRRGFVYTALATAAIGRQRLVSRRLLLRASKRQTVPQQAEFGGGRRLLLGSSSILLAKVSPPVASADAGSTPKAADAPTFVRTAPEAAKLLWNTAGAVDENEFALDCSYESLSASFVFPSLGRSASAAAGRHKHQPAGRRFVIDRVSDGLEACGLVWHTEENGEDGVDVVERGLTFVRIDKDRRVCYVREIGEPGDKSGLSTDQFSQLLSSSADKTPSPSIPSELLQEGEVSRTASDIVKYLYGPTGSNKVSTVDKKMGVNVSHLFSDDVLYEDLNYEQPFVGRAAVEAFLGRFQATQGQATKGVTFEVEDTSEGSRAVCYTYLIRIAGQYKAIKGVAFLEVDRNGKVCYMRDIAIRSVSPPPLQLSAQRFDGGGLRRYDEGGDTRMGGVGRFGS
ncbi:unnamed protein product [Polarella glacialis]|uniref:SnoaL-like domain-containing protein n=1 Tax=Polarella glacialis TaxID=89957 RepID=A0A813FLC8_POLGL|nr:unnamed protein product [Polarella glacialis]CAE8743789.1 unnamed protein product [Polarella glacialis]|mmetsp:Transcript_84005/g.151612  ORF Transcript_84005/g.151612 Transcript_84005/m.151612 type:complete len:442 (+) Transcript_84005:13-1338(+)